MTNRFETELKRMLLDIKKHPSIIHDIYKNIYWEMKRPFYTYWCLYIYIPKILSISKLTEIMEEIDVEYIINTNKTTYGIWIDFAHLYDFSPPSIDGEELIWYRDYGIRGSEYSYKDYNYVKNIMITTIDKITTNLKIL